MSTGPGSVTLCGWFIPLVEKRVDDPLLDPWFHVKIKLFFFNFRPEPPQSVHRPIFLFQAWFHHEMK